MKQIPVIIGIALTSLWAGCSSTPLAVAPVGPNPFGVNNHAQDGQLEVFSAITGRSEGDDPAWFQHTGYSLYDAQGRKVKRVDNTVGYYASRPRVISLPPGKYIVKAEAKDFRAVEVPVTVKAGKTTRVHLDGNWHPANASSASVVDLPSGAPVGWKTDAW